MDEKQFQVIFKTGRDQTVQCRKCSAKSDPVREGEGVEKWCEEHVCGEEPKVAEEKSEETAPEPELPGEPSQDDSEDISDEEEDEEEDGD